MIVELDVPFADTGASQLSYLASAPDMPVLAELAHRDLVPDGHLSLRLLGASHQAVLATSQGVYAETLACLDRPGGTVPPVRTLQVGPWQFRLRIETDRVPAEALATACRELRRCSTRDDPRGSLYASFPGHPLAATFLRVRPAGQTSAGRGCGHPGVPAWTTVHVYPESGERVRTRTDIVPVGTAPGAGGGRPRHVREAV